MLTDGGTCMPCEGRPTESKDFQSKIYNGFINKSIVRNKESIELC